MHHILLAEAHPVVRTGYRMLVQRSMPDLVFDDVDCRSALLLALASGQWDLVVLDLTLPDRPGLETLKDICERFPGIRVLTTSHTPDLSYASEAFRLGALGFVSKTCWAEEFVVAIQRVLAGQRYVTPDIVDRIDFHDEDFGRTRPHERLSKRESDVFRRLAAGQRITAIALEMNLSVKTISTYRTRILDKMRLGTNSDLTTYAMRHQITLPETPANGDGSEDDPQDH